MNLKKILGLVAAAGLLFIAAPSDKASAMSLSGPGVAAAAAVQGSVNEALVSEVQYRHRHRHVRPHRHYYRPPVVRRHHYHPRPRHHHHRYYRY